MNRSCSRYRPLFVLFVLVISTVRAKCDDCGNTRVRQDSFKEHRDKIEDVSTCPTVPGPCTGLNRVGTWENRSQEGFMDKGSQSI